MKYSHILITGGAGFIGSSLALFLKERYPRVRVTALDNLKRRGSELNPSRLSGAGVRFIHGDIRCPEDLGMHRRADLIIECSAEPSVLAGYSDNPAYIINTNLAGAVNCFELARKNKADILFLSTSRVYPFGAVNALGYGEQKTRFFWKSQQRPGLSKNGIGVDFPLSGPRTLYGATKLTAEQLLTEYLDAYGLKGVITRLGVVAGPGQFGRSDQGVFTYWMLAHYFKKPLTYIGFGAQGKQVRDLLHIGDLCTLIARQIELLPRISGRVYNAGGGMHVSLSLCEATTLCRKITGNKVPIAKKKEARPGDIRIYISDNTRCSRECGWKPTRSAEQICVDTFEWIRASEAKIDW